MPQAKKTTAKKATAKTGNSRNTINPHEQALQEITSNPSWSQLKGAVVAAACKLYQSGQLKSAADISALLTPLDDEIREAIGIATGLREGKQEDKLITMIVNGHNLYESIDILKNMGSITLNPEQARNIILSHHNDEASWQATSLQECYYPLVFLHEIDLWVLVEQDKHKVFFNSNCSMAFGLDENGNRELLAFHFDEPRNCNVKRSTTPYRELLKKLKERQLPAPLLFGGDYKGSDFTQQHLAEFFPQAYFIPAHQSTSTQVRQQVDSTLGLRSNYRQIFKALYQCQSIAEYKDTVRPLINSVECWQSLLAPITKAMHQVFCPEVEQALFALPPALRKVLCEKPPFADDATNIKIMLSNSDLDDSTFYKIILHQYYLQVLRPLWQPPVGSWKRIKGDLQSFTQTMQDAKVRAVQVVQARA